MKLCRWLIVCLVLAFALCAGVVYAEGEPSLIEVEIDLSQVPERFDHHLNVDFTVSGEGAGSFSASISGPNGQVASAQSETGEFSFAGELFDPHTFYHLTVSAEGTEGYQDTTASKTILVGAVDESVGITLGGQTGQVNLPVYAVRTLSVVTPQPNAWIRLGQDEAEWQYVQADESGCFTLNYFEDQICDRTLWAQYSSDMVHWSGLSDIVSVHVYSDGAFAMPDCVLSASSVRRGEFAQITIPGGGDEAVYNVRAEKLAVGETNPPESIWSGWDAETCVMTVNTYQLEAGEYSLHVYGHAPGRTESERQYPFTVTDVNQGEVLFTFDKTQVQTYENYVFELYAPGANGVRVYENGNNRFEDYYIDHGMTSFRQEKSGEYMYTAQVHYGDDPYGEEGWVNVGEPVTVTVNADYGQVSVSVTGLPDRMEPGEDLDFTLVSEEATEYSVHIWCMTAGIGEIMPFEEDNETGEFHIDAGWFQPNMVYSVDIDAYASKGYESAHMNRVFVVAELSPDIEITLDGATDIQSILVNKAYSVHVEAPSAANCLRIYMGGLWGSDFSNTYDYREWSIGKPGEYLFFAMYSEDSGFTWNGVSNIIHVSANSNGAVPVPGGTLSASTVYRGQTVRVDLDNFITNEGVRYYASLDRIDQSEWDGYSENGMVAEWDGVNGITIHTVELYAGEYTVKLTGYGEGLTTSESVIGTLTITEPEGVVFVVDKTTVQTCETFTISAYVPESFESQWMAEEGLAAGQADRRGLRLYRNGKYLWDTDQFFAKWTLQEGDVADIEFTLSVSMRYDSYDGVSYPPPEISYAIDSWTDPGYPQQVHVEAPNGPMEDRVTAVIPHRVAPGEDLEFYMSEYDDATLYKAYLLRGYENARLERATGGDFVFDKDLFTPYQTYQVSVEVYGVGYIPLRKTENVFVVPASTGDITLIVDGQADVVQALKYQQLEAVAQAPADAAWVRIFNGYAWEYSNGQTSSITIGSNSAMIVAQYTRDDLDQLTDWSSANWVGTSNVVEIRGVCYGTLSETQAVMTKTEVERGEIARITLTPANVEGISYYADVYAWDDATGQIGWYSARWPWNGANGIAVSTIDMPAGQYHIFVGSHAVGWEDGSGGELVLRVNENGTAVFDVDNTEPLTGQNYTFSAYVPDAAAIWIQTQDGADTVNYISGQSTAETRSKDISGATTYVLKARMNGSDEWTLIGEPITVNVQAPNGPLSAPEVTVPIRHAPGQDLTVTVSQVEDAQRYRVSVYYPYGGYSIGEQTSAQAGTFTFSGSEITEVGRYIVKVDVLGAGYDAFHAEKDVFVIHPVDNSVTLTVDGQEGDVQIPIHKYAVARISAPGATMIRMFNGSSWQYWYADDVMGDFVETGLSFSEAGQYYIAAEYTTDGDDWGMMNSYTWKGSDIVTVDVYSNGPMPCPQYTITPENPRVGEDIRIDVEPMEGTGVYYSASVTLRGKENIVYSNSWDETGLIVLDNTGAYGGTELTIWLRCSAEGYEQTEYPIDVDLISYGPMTAPAFTLAGDTVPKGVPVCVTVAPYGLEGEKHRVELTRKSDGTKVNEGRFDRMRTVPLETARLEPGEYTVTVYGSAVGYTESCVSADVTVTAAGSDDIVFYVNDTELLTGQALVVSVYAPGAEQVGVFRDGRLDWYDYDDSYSFMVSPDEPAEYIYTAGARYSGSEEWIMSDVTHTVTFTAPYGKVNPVVIAPPLIVCDQPVQIGLGEVEGAFEYILSIDDRDAWETVYSRTDSVPFTHTFACGTFEAGRQYTIYWTVRGEGYEAGYGQRTIYAVNAVDPDVTVKVNGMSGTVQALVNREYDITVQGPANATAVRYDMGNGWRYEKGNSITLQQVWSVVGSQSITAEYTADILENDWPDWEELTWSNPGEPVVVNVTSNGRMPLPTVSLTADHVKKGEIIVYHITPIGLDEENYHYNLQRNSDGMSFSSGYWNGQADDYILESTETVAGEHTLTITGTALGYESASVKLPILISEPEEGEIVFTVNKNAVLTSEKLLALAYASGAYQTRILLNGNEFVKFYDEDVWLSETFNDERTFDLTAQARWSDDGDWQDAGQVYHIQVTAPYGEADAEFAVSERLNTNGMMTVNFGTASQGSSHRVVIYDSSWYKIAEVSGSDTYFELDAGRLQENERYYVSGFGEGAGYISASSTQTIFVTRDTDGLRIIALGDEALFTLDRSTVLTHQYFTLTAYVPGAAELAIYETQGDSSGCRGISDGNFAAHHWMVNTRGVSTFTLKARMDGSGEWVDVGDALTLDVQAPYGDLVPPTVYLPSQIGPGENLTVTVGECAHGEVYCININDQMDGHSVGYAEDDTFGTFTFDAGSFEEGHTYWVSLDVLATGWNAAHADYDLLVLGAQTDDSVTLSLNGQTGQVEIYAGTSVEVAITAPETATALRYFNGRGWRYFNSFDEDFVHENGQITFRYWDNWYDTGDVLMFAEYTEDDFGDSPQYGWESLNWSHHGNILNVSVQQVEHGTLTFTMDKTDVLTCETVNVTLNAPGANYIEVFERWEYDGQVEERQSYSVYEGFRNLPKRFTEPGTYSYTVYLYYPDGDEIVVSEGMPVVHVSMQHDEPVPITVTMGDHAASGEPYQFTVSMPGDFDGWYEVHIDDCDIDGLNCELTGTHTFTIPAEMMREGKYYYLQVNAFGLGYRGRYQAWDIFVIPEAEEDAIFTVNGSASDLQVYINEEIEIYFDAPDAVSGQIYDGNGWDTLWNIPGYIYTSFDDPGQYTLFIRYTDEYIDFYDDEVDWDSIDWKYTDQIKVTVTKLGDLPPIRYNLSSNTLLRGDIFTVTILDPVEGAQYTAWLGDWPFRWDGIDTILVDTTTSGLGEVPLSITARKPGYPIPWEFDTVTVTEPETEQPYFRATATEVETFEQYVLSGFAPGAVCLKIDETYEYGEPCEVTGQFGYGITYTNSMPYDDTVTYTLYAMFSEEGEWEQVLEPITITVEAPYGDFDDLTYSVPSVLEPGEDLTVYISPVSGAASYGVDLLDATSNHQLSRMENSVGGTFTIDGSCLEAGKTYVVNVSVWGRGYNMFVRQKTLLVSSLADDITLTINGSAESYNALVNERYVVHVEAPEAAKAIRIIHDDGCDVRVGHSVDVGFVSRYVEDVTFSAQYTLDNADESMNEQQLNALTWSGVSNSVSLHATKLGDMPVPAYTVTPGLRVARGQNLTVSFTPAGIEGESYYLEAFNPNLNYENAITYFGEYDGNGVMTLDTSDMEPGLYLMYFSGRAPGYQYFSVELNLYVLDESGNAVFLTLSKTDLTLDIDNETTAHVYAPGAEAIELYCNGDQYERVEADTLDYTFTFYRQGEYEIFARAIYSDGTSSDSAASVVTMGALGVLDAPTIELHGIDSTLEAGQDLTFTVDSVVGAEGYSIYVEWFDTSRMDMWEEVAYYSVPGTYTVPANKFSTGEMYMVYARANKPGYDSKVSEKSFIVIEPSWSKGTLEIIGLEPDGTAWVNKPFRVVMEAAGATAIKWKPGENYAWQYLEGGQHSFDYSLYMPGTKHIIAMYTTEEIPEGKHLSEITNWTGYFDPVTIQVNSYGSLQADYTLSGPVVPVSGGYHEYEVHQGSIIGLRLSYQPEPDYYRVSYYGFNSSGESYDGRTYENTNGYFELDTSEWQPGNVVVSLGVHKDGWIDPMQSIRFTVLEPEERAVNFTVEPQEMLLLEMPEMRVSALGACRIDIYEGDTLLTSFDGASWSGVTGYSEGEHTLYAIATYPDGTTVRSEDVTFRVRVLGEIPAPEFIMPRTIYAGETLAVNVQPVEGAAGAVVMVLDGDGEIITFGRTTGSAGGTIVVDTSALAPGVCAVSVGTSSSTPGYKGGMVNTSLLVLDRSAPVMALPANLTQIEEQAFAGLPAKIVRIPAGVTQIGSRAFADCGGLGFVIFEGDGGTIADDAFAGSAYVTFICPEGSAAARYADAQGIARRTR